MDAALRPFFDPKGVALIGASREEEKPGHVILKLLLENKKNGILQAPIYPVNPNADVILGQKVYKSISDLPGEVDLAIIVVPARFVPSIVSELGDKGVKAVVVISSGFSEIGRTDLEEALKIEARKKGIRVLGPNCVGIFSPWTGVDTIFLPYTKRLSDGRDVLSAPRPPRGHVALISQSGAVGTAALDYMHGEGIGLSYFFSIGNKADVDEVELIQALGDDEKTRVILLYLESIARGRAFIEVASKVSAKKPIIAMKTGRTQAGRRAAASHTASLAGTDEIYEAAFRRSGVIRAQDIEELFDFAKAFATQPPPQGPRIAIVTDGGGAGVMATDMAEFLGLQVPELKGETRAKLEDLRREGRVPEFAQLSNPVDLTGSATSEMFVDATRVLLESPDVDAVAILALHQVPGIPDPVDLARKLSSLAKGYSKPVVAVDTGWSEAALLERKEFDKNGIPAYPTPERAIKALWALEKYGEWLRQRGTFKEYLNTFRSISI
ncbi:MAG: CoA-binding protein [Infirmifilum sp.]